MNCFSLEHPARHSRNQNSKFEARNPTQILKTEITMFQFWKENKGQCFQDNFVRSIRENLKETVKFLWLLRFFAAIKNEK